MVSPALAKPKSKLRLRLGLTPPHPKPAQAKKKQAPVPVASNPSALSSVASLGQTSSHRGSPRRDGYAAGHPPGESTSLSMASSERPDSRSAFTYDHSSPSTNGPTPPKAAAGGAAAAFDTISYRTQSPSSLALSNISTSTASLLPHESGHDASSSSSATVDGRAVAQAHSAYRQIPDQQHQQSHQQTYAHDSHQQRHHHHHLQQQPVVSGQWAPQYHQQQHHVAGPTASVDFSLPYGAHTRDASGGGGQGPSDGQEYPGITAATATYDDVYSISDQVLSDRFAFIEEIGFGNWGSVWKCKPRRNRDSELEGAYNPKDDPEYRRRVACLGKSSAAMGGSGGGGVVAIKLVFREKSSTTAARVKALWGEMKIIRSLRHEPHPSIIQFEAFVISDSFALVIMPHMRRLIPVSLDPQLAVPYFRQLASAVGYLHERGITHNDIKPANVLLNYNDVPVLVDFGFAVKWDTRDRTAFLSNISWGTPEYLDPQRAQGLPHDERASDVWALGVSMYEILIGRTPFEMDEEEVLESDEDLRIYLDRTRQGVWLGEWSMPNDLQHLIRSMVCPDPAYRITAMEAYHHPALALPAPNVIVTPHFVRAAASYDDELPPMPVAHPEEARAPAPTARLVAAPAVPDVASEAEADAEKKKQQQRKKKQEASRGRAATGGPKGRHARSATPTALGESIKQHTAVATEKVPSKHGDGKDAAPVAKLVIRQPRVEDDENVRPPEETTPTKITKPAQPLRIREMTSYEKNLSMRVSNSQSPTLGHSASRTTLRSDASTTRPAMSTQTSSNNFISARSSLDTTAPVLSHRDSSLSLASATSTQPANKEDAVLKAMRSLEGGKTLKLKESQHFRKKVFENIARPAPEPPRPQSLEAAQGSPDDDESMVIVRSPRIQSGLDQVEQTTTRAPSQAAFDLALQSPVSPTKIHIDISVRASPPKSGNVVTSLEDIGSPARKRMAKPATPSKTAAADEEVVHELLDKTDTVVPNDVRRSLLLQKEGQSHEEVEALRHLRERILHEDEERAARFKAASRAAEDLPEEDRPPMPSLEAVADLIPDVGIPVALRPQSPEAAALDSRLDKISEWVKSVEKIVEDARRAIAEGREVPLPALGLTLPEAAAVVASVSQPGSSAGAAEKTLASHLRTASTQVEPATPPKWMTYAEAEEKVRAANEEFEKRASITGEPKPMVVPGPKKKERTSVSHVLQLFGADKPEKKDKLANRASTPEPNLKVALKPPQSLRGAPSTPALRSPAKVRVPQRNSESNLRAYNTMPTLVPLAEVLRPDIDLDAYDEQEHERERDGGATSTETDEALASPTSAESPRVIFEKFLDTTPGVVRQGDGWSSFAPPPSHASRMAKPSSMASLREKARAFLGVSSHSHAQAHAAEQPKRDIRDLSASAPLASEDTAGPRRTIKEKRSSRTLLGRPLTPGPTTALASTADLREQVRPAGKAPKDREKGRGLWGMRRGKKQ